MCVCVYVCVCMHACPRMCVLESLCIYTHRGSFEDVSLPLHGNLQKWESYTTLLHLLWPDLHSSLPLSQSTTPPLSLKCSRSPPSPPPPYLSLLLAKKKQMQKNLQPQWTFSFCVWPYNDQTMYRNIFSQGYSCFDRKDFFFLKPLKICSQSDVVNDMK